MNKLVPICLNDSEQLCDSYASIYGKEKIKNMYCIGYIEQLNYLSDSDATIANRYNISSIKYKQIVKKNHGYHDITFDYDNHIFFNFVFNCKEDCQKAIDDLQPYIIIGILKK